MTDEVAGSGTGVKGTLKATLFEPLEKPCIAMPTDWSNVPMPTGPYRDCMAVASKNA